MPEPAAASVEELLGPDAVFDVHTGDWFLNTERALRRPLLPYYEGKIRRCELVWGEHDDLSLQAIEMEAGFLVPTHYHDIDQVQLVVDGEIWMGSRRIRPGQGVYTPAGRAYSFTMGPQGGRMLEFREGAHLRTAYRGRGTEIVGEGALTDIDGWPGRGKDDDSDKVVFFDVETTPYASTAGFGPGDSHSYLPGEVRGRVAWQSLVSFPSSRSNSLVGASVEAGTRIPPHAQDADRILYVLSGQMTLGAAGELRSGHGAVWPAGVASEITAGDAGVRYVEFRETSSWTTRWMP